MIPLQRIGRSEAEDDGAPFTPAFDFNYAESLKASYAAARERLYGAGRIYQREAAPTIRKRPRPSYRLVSKTPFGPPQETWGEFIARVAARPTTMADIIKEVAEKHGLTFLDLISQSRVRKLTIARHEAMYRCAAETKASTPRIGEALGGRDHTTIIHGIRRHAELNNLKLPRGMTSTDDAKSFRLSRIGVGA